MSIARTRISTRPMLEWFTGTALITCAVVDMGMPALAVDLDCYIEPNLLREMRGV